MQAFKVCRIQFNNKKIQALKYVIFLNLFNFCFNTVLAIYFNNLTTFFKNGFI